MRYRSIGLVVATTAALLGWTSAAQAGGGAVIHVPQDYESIQDAIDAANPGDTIEVAAEGGPYYEELNIYKDGLTVETPDGAVVSDYISSSAVVEINAVNVVFQGFQIENYYDVARGGSTASIRIDGESVGAGSATVQDCTIAADGVEAGVLVDPPVLGGSVNITGNTFMRLSAAARWGGGSGGAFFDAIRFESEYNDSLNVYVSAQSTTIDLSNNTIYSFDAAGIRFSGVVIASEITIQGGNYTTDDASTLRGDSEAAIVFDGDYLSAARGYDSNGSIDSFSSVNISDVLVSHVFFGVYVRSNISNASNVTINNMDIDGYLGTAFYVDGYVQNSSSLSMQDCTLQQSTDATRGDSGYGLYLDGGVESNSTVHIENCEFLGFSNTGIGFDYVCDGSTMSVLGSRFEGGASADSGIQVWNSICDVSLLEVRNTTISGFQSTGLEVDYNLDWGGRLEMSDTTIDCQPAAPRGDGGAPYALYLTDEYNGGLSNASSVRIERCRLVNFTDTGVFVGAYMYDYLRGGNAYPFGSLTEGSSFVLDGNEIRGAAAYAGIYFESMIDGGSSVEIVNHRHESNPAAGGTPLEGQISGWTDEGIYVGEDNEYDGSVVGGSSLRIADNQITGQSLERGNQAPYDAIYVEGYVDGSTFTAERNQISNFNEYGIYLNSVYDLATATIRENVIESGDATYPVGVDIGDLEYGALLRVSSNQITVHASEDGVGLAIDYMNYAGRAEVCDNRLDGTNNGSGFAGVAFNSALLSGCSASVRRNEITGFQYGVGAYYGPRNGSELVVQSNQISQCGAGVEIYYGPSDGAHVLIERNTMTEMYEAGVNVNDAFEDAAMSLSRFDVIENRIGAAQPMARGIFPAVAIYGHVQDASQVSVSDNCMTGFYQGLLVSSSLLDTSTAQANGNDFSGLIPQGRGVAYIDAPDFPIHAENNWWGPGGPGNGNPDTEGAVSTDPYLDAAPDTDGDGVANCSDECPGTASGAPVDDKGCALTDQDGDGVYDQNDLCPDTPTCARPVDAKGCPGDDDQDGVYNGCDACPNTAMGDPVDSTGCSTADSDGDGVKNDADACPNTPRCATTVDANGCPLDSDNDGSPDGCDLCPNDPAKTQPGACGCGMPDIDANGDGVPDCFTIDLCPNDPDKTQPGVCGCGVPDTDANGDGIPDCLSYDLCPNDPNKTLPGVCGCGVPDTDSDGDGIPDCVDQNQPAPQPNPQPGPKLGPFIPLLPFVPFPICGIGWGFTLMATMIPLMAARVIRTRRRR